MKLVAWATAKIGLHRKTCCPKRSFFKLEWWVKRDPDGISGGFLRCKRREVRKVGEGPKTSEPHQPHVRGRSRRVRGASSLSDTEWRGCKIICSEVTSGGIFLFGRDSRMLYRNVSLHGSVCGDCSYFCLASQPFIARRQVTMSLICQALELPFPCLHPSEKD